MSAIAAILLATVINIAPPAFQGLPRVSAKFTDHHTKGTAEYEGVTLRALLTKAGVPAGEDIRGKSLSFVVIVRAADGYRAVYSLTELDPLFSKKLFLLADRKDGKPLPEKEGPYRMIVPDETRAARSVRQVTQIEVKPVE